MSPTESIIHNLAAVRDAFALHPGATPAWRYLQGTCPALSAAMSCNTFRATAPVVLATAAQLHGARVTPSEPPPRNYRGWTLCPGKDGLLRAHRRVNGKGYSLYFGKTWDPARADAAIAKFETRARERIAGKALA